jgi:hypothetical protein
MLDQTPIPVRPSHLAQQLQVDYNVLKYHFPEGYRELRRRYIEWDNLRRKNAHQARIEKLFTGVFDLARVVIYPSERKLRELEYVAQGDLRRDEIIEVLRALQNYYRNHGY